MSWTTNSTNSINDKKKIEIIENENIKKEKIKKEEEKNNNKNIKMKRGILDETKVIRCVKVRIKPNTIQKKKINAYMKGNLIYFYFYFFKFNFLKKFLILITIYLWKIFKKKILKTWILKQLKQKENISDGKKCETFYSTKIKI
jgi:hypothetical protein